MNTIESRYDEFVEYNFISNDELQRNTLKKNLSNMVGEK